MKAFALLALAFASPAAADVVSASSNGFEVREVVTLDTAPAGAFAAFGRIASWWSAEHTYGGNAANLSLSETPGGCFCEKLANGGGVEHMRVAYVEPGKRLVLTGPLGPLLYLATTGVMDVSFEPAGTGTRVVLDYRAAGFFNGGADKMAPAVDAVLAEQAKRLQASVSSKR